MKMKLAVIYGISIWVLTNALTYIFNPISHHNLQYANLIAPLILIIVTGFFGILYIRNIESNEVIEGILAGIVFIAVNVILDYIVFILPKNTNMITNNYPLHFFSLIIITLIITTFLGYLAQMNIDLK